MAVTGAAEQHTSAVEEDTVEAAAADSDEEVDSSETDGSEGSDLHEGGTKKRKKKKKKRKGCGGGSGGTAAAQPLLDPAARKEGEKRLQEALDLLSHNSEDGMWVKLNGCYLPDGKLKKLCEALRANTNCISLDLSANQLTDEGAKALAAALGDGRAPDLIELDLRDNPQIDKDGAAALEELQQQRKSLRVALGPSQPPPPPEPQQPSGKPRSPKAGQQQQGPHMNGSSGGGGSGSSDGSNGGEGSGSLADAVKNNPVISKYFAVGNEDVEEDEERQQGGQGGDPAGAEQEEQEQLGGLSADELARLLWDQLEQCLDAPRPHIPAVSEPLRALVEQVEHEMDNCVIPMLSSTEVGELKTFTQWALRKLHLLHSVLDLVPPPILTPYSKSTPVAAVGTHRVAVAELLAQLLRGECAGIAREVAVSGLLRRCAAIAVSHPNCSPIHGAVVRCLKLSLSKAVGHVGLWQQLLGSAPAAAAAGAASADRGASLNLATAAAAIAAAGARAPSVGKRAANVGFALAVGQVLHAAETGEMLGAGSGGEAEAAEQQGADADAAGIAEAGAGSGGAAAAAAESAPRSGDSDGGSGGDSASSSPQQQQQQAEQQSEQQQSAAPGQDSSGTQQAAGGPAAAPGAAAAEPTSHPLNADALGELNPLVLQPSSDSLQRTSSQPTLARMASGVGAVADLPPPEEGWERQLRAHLASAGPWVEFSTGRDCLLRTLLGEHVGDLGGPRPRPGVPPPAEEDEDGAGHGQVISGQELLMMLRGLNLGGFSGGI